MTNSIRISLLRSRGPFSIADRRGRLKGPQEEERRVQRYRELVSLTRKIVRQVEGVLKETQHRLRHRQARLKRLREILETMAGRVRQVVRQTKARVFQGITKYPHKIVSLFEPHSEIIRKGNGAQSVIPAKRGKKTWRVRGVRSEMRRAFRARLYRRRTLIEIVFSSVNRKLSARTQGRSLPMQVRQAQLLGLSFNLYRLRYRYIF